MPNLITYPRVRTGGVKHHDDTAAELAHYLDRASHRAAKRMGSCSHEFATKEAQPLLRKSRVNRILVYGGVSLPERPLESKTNIQQAFNPPHRGHPLVLQHEFRECGADLNVVAALVMLKNDDYLESKNQTTGCELFCKSNLGTTFTYLDTDYIVTVNLSERTALWSTDVEFLDWAWMISEGELTFGDKLQKLAKADGFDIELIGLAGPDNFSTTTYVVLDRGRSISCEDANMSLTPQLVILVLLRLQPNPHQHSSTCPA